MQRSSIELRALVVGAVLTCVTVAGALADDRSDCLAASIAAPARIAACTRALAEASSAERADLLLRRGDARRRQGADAEAIEDYSAALRLEPDLPAARVNRGLALRRLGRLDAALADYDAVLAIEPDHLEALNNRATVHALRGEHALAIADLDRLLAADPSMAPAYFNRAVARIAVGDPSGALADIDRLLATSPGDRDALAVREKALAALRRDRPTSTTARERTDVEARGDLPVVTLRAERNRQEPSSRPVAPSPSPPIVAAARIETPAAVPATPAPIATVEGERVALVIGNGRYRHVGLLTNPERDAAAMAKALQSIGFTVEGPLVDLDRERMLDRLKGFAAKAEKARIALVFYAGHGIELDGANYLIPIDARITRSRDAEFEAIALPLVLTTVESAKQLGLVILDACRDDPFRATLRAAGATRSLNRGLAPIEPRRGTLVAYAAKHGTAAFDGTTANSPFTAALLRHLATPGLDISLMFRRVGDEVWEATGGEQLPFVYGSLPGDIVALVP